MKRNSIYSVLALLHSLAVTCAILTDIATPAVAEEKSSDYAKAQEVISFLSSLNTMRESLAGTLESQPQIITADTFAQVCKPVGLRLSTQSKETGWQSTQLSQKYRNPKHAITIQDQKVQRFFSNNPGIDAVVIKGPPSAEADITVYHRITVQKGCLSCHGKKESRPQFIVDKYPQDKAYDFKQGDLRGFYKVVVPDKQDK